MKQRFTTFDLVAVVAELQKTIVGQRLQNIYDIDGKTYLLKFASGENKHLLYIQSGTRIHLTDYDWAKNAMPGGFSMKLRKHVRQKRLESVSQLGIDRIVDMQFGTNELAFHLIIELYDRGNLVLTDHTYKILIVLRKRVDETSDSHFEQDAHYPIDSVRKQDPALFATEHLRTRCVEYLATCDAPQGGEREAEQEAKGKGKKPEADKKPAKGGGPKKNAQRVRNRTTLSSVLNALFPFGTQLVAHALHTNGLRDAPIETYLDNNELFTCVTAAMSDAQRVFEETRCGAHAEGIVVKRRRVAPPGSVDTTSEEMNYEEYHPILFAQLAAADAQTQFERFESFNAAVDEYYTHAEKLRTAQRAAEKRTAAARRLENVRRDHELRVQQLDADVRACRLKACTIERNADLVDKTIRIVNSLVAQQLGWEAINEQVEAARRLDDPVATRIDRLLLDRNQVALRFPYEPENEAESDANAGVDSSAQVQPDGTDATVKAVSGTVDKGKRKRAGAASRQADTDPSVLVVEVDLGMSAYANVERYYELQKRAAEKAKRTLAASSDALRNAQRSYAAELAAAQRDVRILQRAAASAMASKRTLWFEKFRWFVSSDCYLVLAGATQSQNETLVKHYLRTRDIYVHADLHGAASVVIKNPRGGPIPPRTLEEAGDFALCNSAAWDSRLVSNAWWVYAEQVSKTPPTGMYVSAGSFIIRGRKNYLRPTSLLFGFAFLFRLAPESAQRRKQLAPADHDQLGEMPDEVLSRTESVTYDDADEDDDESEAASRLAQLTVEPSLTDDDKHSQIAPTSAILHQERFDSQSQPDDAGEKTAAAEQNKRIISRAERRRLKKDRDGTRVSRTSESEVPRADNNADDSDGDDENDDGRSAASGPTKGNTAQNVKAAQNAPIKRGQRAKLKKIKERYADQDDEERTLRMNILKGVGTARSEKKQKEREEHEQRSRVAKEKAERAKQKREAKEKQAQSARGRPVEDQDREGKGANDDDFDDAPSESDEEQQRPDQLTELLLSLTGNLLSDDVALQAVPVCAPYAALNRYKFKVKLQPGTTKRSKAVKFALDVFLQDKNATDIEKALIKAVVEQDLSRNFPGKVKVSAPNLLRLHTNAKAKSSAKQKHAAAN